jgi:hypothetical protein|nr:plasmid mobilization relaxosome protein MobC [Neorhizobium tomejilense]
MANESARELVVGGDWAAARKDRVVHVRLASSDYEAIERSSIAADMTLSAFLRSLALEGAGVRPFFNDEDRVILSVLVSDMRASGAILGRLARAANSGRSSMPIELGETLAQVQQLMAAIAMEMRRYAERGRRLRRGV